ncbi:MAG: nucleoside monophosphate kinase [Candidatus Saccharibacteria bacterium]
MILLMGLAGTGKGTQGKLLAELHGMRLISMGDVVREYASENQRDRMLAGDLLADDETIDMLDQFLASLDDEHEVILDGFPRSVPQAEWLLKQVQAGRFDVRLAFHLLASREALKQRLLARGRADDNDEVIAKRFDEYDKSTAPLLKWLEDHGIDVVNVDAERPVDVIQAEMVQQLQQ